MFNSKHSQPSQRGQSAQPASLAPAFIFDICLLELFCFICFASRRLTFSRFSFCFLLLAFILLSHEKALSINPVWKSIIFPGWGEHALEENKRSRLFSNIELSLWTACLGAYTYSHHSMLQYKSFAVEHAGVLSSGKDKKYWV